jgi:hypothetical protein
MNRHHRDLRRLARRLGFRVERRARHYRLHHPSGAVVIASASPSTAGELRVVEGCLRRELRHHHAPAGAQSRRPKKMFKGRFTDREAWLAWVAAERGSASPLKQIRQHLAGGSLSFHSLATVPVAWSVAWSAAWDINEDNDARQNVWTCAVAPVAASLRGVEPASDTA